MIFNASQRAIEKLFTPATYDCHFRIENTLIGGHRKLLSALSPVFELMFNSENSDNYNNNFDDMEINDPNISHDGFTEFLQYFYKDRITLTANNVAEMLFLAEGYQTPQIVAQCSQFLLDRLSVMNAIQTLGLAIKYNLDTLNSACIKIISKNTDASLKSEVFQECDAHALKAILSIEQKSCGEEKVFAACIEWAKVKCEEKSLDAENKETLRKELGECFELIQFKKMPRQAFGDLYGEWKELFNRNEIDDMILHLCKLDVNQQPSVDGNMQATPKLIDFTSPSPFLIDSLRASPSNTMTNVFQRTNSLFPSQSRTILMRAKRIGPSSSLG